MRRNISRTCCFVLILSTVALTPACGEDEEGPEPRFPANPGAISITTEQRGFPLEANRSYSANRVKYETHQAQVSALFIYEQIYSEYVDATEGSGVSRELPDRIDDIFDDYGNQLALYDTRYIVVDLQRRDREWLVDWEGLRRDEPDNRAVFNFGRRDDYWLDVQDRLEETVFRAAPDAVIIGMEMNRYYQQNPTDWPNFIDFFWTMYDAIKTADPGVRVAAGMNWSYFMESQVAAFTQTNQSATDVRPFERAYAAIIDPLVRRFDAEGQVIGGSDFVALAAIPDPVIHGNSPANVPDEHFGALRHAFGRDAAPIVWFQLGWPVRSGTSAVPAEFYTRFQESAGGLNIERVSWWGLSHLLDADCTPLTGTDIGAPDSICFRGLFSVSGADTALSRLYLPTEE